MGLFFKLDHHLTNPKVVEAILGISSPCKARSAGRPLHPRSLTASLPLKNAAKGREAFVFGSWQFIKGQLLNFRWVSLQVQVGFPHESPPFVWETASESPPNMFLDFFCIFRTYHILVPLPETNSHQNP